MSVEYFVNFEAIHGEPLQCGPFTDLSEAKGCFENTYPAFDGAFVTLTKIECDIPGLNPSDLLRKGLEEEYDYMHDPESDFSWGKTLSENTTLLAKETYNVSQDRAGELVYKHGGKEYLPSFAAELQVQNRESDMHKELKKLRLEVELQAEKITELREHNAEFLAQRNAAQQLNQKFYECIESAHRDWGGQFPYPSELMRRCEEARGLHGYEFPMDHKQSELVQEPIYDKSLNGGPNAREYSRELEPGEVRTMSDSEERKFMKQIGAFLRSKEAAQKEIAKSIDNRDREREEPEIER